MPSPKGQSSRPPYISCLPHFSPQINIELHVSEICLVECQTVCSFICPLSHLSSFSLLGTAVPETLFQTRKQQFCKEFLGNGSSHLFKMEILKPLVEG